MEDQLLKPKESYLRLYCYSNTGLTIIFLIAIANFFIGSTVVYKVLLIAFLVIGFFAVIGLILELFYRYSKYKPETVRKSRKTLIKTRDNLLPVLY